MIKIKVIPNIFEEKGRESKEIQFDRLKTLEKYLEESGFKYPGWKMIVTNQKEPNLKGPLRDGDEVILTPPIKDPVSATIAVFSAIGTWIAANTVQAIILAITIGYSIYQATQKPKMPSFNLATGNFQDSSPTYGWDGIQTLQGDVNIPVAVAGGRHRVGGNIINAFVRTDGEKQYLYLLIGLCEGPIKSISEIQINDNPVENFSSVEVVTRLGTNDQVPIDFFNELHQNYGVNAQITQASPYTYTTQDDQVEAFEVHLKFPNGIYSLNNSGGVDATEVQFKVEHRPTGSMGSWTDDGTISVNEKSRTNVSRIVRVEGVDADQYDIRVTRISDDSTFQNVSDLVLDKIDEITPDDLAYPNTALLGIKALATEQLSGSTPNVTCVIEALEISMPDVKTAGSDPENVLWEDYYYDTETGQYKLLSDGTVLDWDGVTFRDEWAGNPVMFFKNLLVNTRYGMGDYIDTSLIPIDQFVSMAQSCEERVAVLDENGDSYYEKRFRIDAVIDGLSASLDLLVQLSAVFRGMPFYSQGQVQLHMDRPEEPVQIFGMGNIVKDSFSQKWASKKDKFNAIQVGFLDKDQNYKQDVVEDRDDQALLDGAPRNSRQLNLLTTYRSQALREARYARRVSFYIDRLVSFKAGIDAVTCRGGQVIRVSHDIPQYGFSGRVMEAGGTSHVVLDRTVIIEPLKTYSVQVRHADDTVEERVVSSPNGSVSTLDVFEPFDQEPQAFDVYAFGEVGIVTKDFRVIALTREGNFEVGIQGLEYDENVYEDSPIFLPRKKFSALSLGTPNVENLKLTERLVKLGDGTIEDVIDVWWQKPSLVGYYVKQFSSVNIYFSDNDGASWVSRGTSKGISFSIQGNILDGQTYKVAVVSVDEFGKENSIESSPQQTISIIGKSAQPSDLESFLVNQSRDRIFFGWQEVPDVDINGYEIRYGATWESAATVVSGIKGNNYIGLNFSEGENQSYWIKAIDTSGNYSENALEALLTVDNIPFKNIVKDFVEEPTWAGITSDTDVYVDSSGRLRLGVGLLSGTYLCPVRDMDYVATFKIGINSIVVVPDSDTAWDSDDDATFEDDPSRRFSGLEIAGATSFMIRTSDDNITWSAWTPWQPGDYRCRYFQIEMTVERAAADLDLAVESLTYFGDLPDIDETVVDSVSNAGTGLNVVFEKTYHEEPVVNINILSGTGIYFKTTGKDTTGMNVKLYNLAGVSVTGDFEAHIHGI